jgi:D-glycero-D-manno-heptose 1,7-bisphosphate phosphatase
VKPAVFLDRDGVLNIDHSFVHTSEDWEWVPGARAALRRLRNLGYSLIVVTNQSGIGRGFFSSEDVEALHRWLNDHEEAGIDGFYYCPHVDEDNCDCRKPKPGMLRQAIREHRIDRSRSFLVGDNPRDVEAARAAGVRGYLFEGPNLEEALTEILYAEEKFR